MIEKILKNKLYLSLIIAGAAVVIIAVVLLCVFSCGGNSDDIDLSDNGTVVQTPLFDFEKLPDDMDNMVSYPVNYISATDFYKLLEAENRFAVGELFDDKFAEYGATLHHISEIDVSGADVISSRTGKYLEKGELVYDINYTNCEFYEYDIDKDGADELIFYTCELGLKNKNQICTYYILGTEENDIYWCRYNRAWAVTMSDKFDWTSIDLSSTDIENLNAEEECLVVSLMVEGVENEVYGVLACDTSSEEPFYYIESGRYNDLLGRTDGITAKE